MRCPTNITQLQTNLRQQAYYCSSRDTTSTDAETASNIETFLNNQVEKFPNPKSKLVKIYNQIAEKIKERISNTLNAAPTQITIFKGNKDKLSVFSWLDKLINDTYPSTLKANPIIKAFEELSILTGLSFPFQTGFAGELRVGLALNSLKDSNEIEEIISTANNKSLNTILDNIENQGTWITSMMNKKEGVKKIIRNRQFSLDFLGIDFLIKLKDEEGKKQYIPIQVKQSENAVNRFYKKARKITFDSTNKIKQLFELLGQQTKNSKEDSLKFKRKPSIPCISIENKSISDLQKSLRKIINDAKTKKLVLEETFDAEKYKLNQDYNFALSAEFFKQGFLHVQNTFCAA